jgi:hypothetical protein
VAAVGAATVEGEGGVVMSLIFGDWGRNTTGDDFIEVGTNGEGDRVILRVQEYMGARAQANLSPDDVDAVVAGLVDAVKRTDAKRTKSPPPAPRVSPEPLFRIWSDHYNSWYRSEIPGRDRTAGYTHIPGEAGLWTKSEADFIISRSRFNGDRLYAAEAQAPAAVLDGPSKAEPKPCVERLAELEKRMGKIETANVLSMGEHCTLANQGARIDAQAGRALAGVAELENRRDDFERRFDDVGDRLDSHESCIEGHRKSLCAVIKRLDVVDKRGVIAALIGDHPNLSPRDNCAKNHVQACHCCERLACGDNTSPGAGLYQAAKLLINVLADTGGGKLEIEPLQAAVKQLGEMA